MMAEFRVHRVNFFDFVPKAIHNLAFDEKSEKLALSRSDGSVEIWSLKDDWFQEKILPPCEDNSVEALMWCQGHLLSAGFHGNILQHDLLTLTVKKRVSANSGVIWCVAANPGGSQIAAGTEDGCVALFNITNEGVEYSKALDKQEGRILCIAWYSGDNENLIVTGGMDNIRIWSVKSGHAVQRLTLGRQYKNRETIVWCLALARDFTIVSGDSRGKTCFWDGRMGTMLKAFTTHEADILAIVVNKAGNVVYAAGAQAQLVTYESVEESGSGTGKGRTWVRSIVKSQHTHDIRAITLTHNQVVTGGVDCNLIFNTLAKTKENRFWRRIAPIPQVGSLVSTAADANMLLLQYTDYLQLWKLGRTMAQTDQTNAILPLRAKPVKLVELKTRSDAILCSALSADGSTIAYSDTDNVRMFSVEMQEVEFEAPSVALTRLKGASRSEFLPARCLRFTRDRKMLVSATCQGSVQLISLDPRPAVQHTFCPEPGKETGIHLLSVSRNSKYFAIGGNDCSVRIYHIRKKKYVGSLPTCDHQPTALCFHPTEPQVAVVYTDQKIREYNFREEEYTSWSRQLESRDYHPQWLKRTSKITHVAYHPAQTHKLVLADEQMICVLDKKQPLPPPSVKIFDKAKWYSSTQTPSSHAFHICNNYKYILHMDLLQEDFMLVVEKTPVAISDQLPPALKQKKFGT